MTALLDLGLHALRSAYCAGTLDVQQVVDEVLKRIAQSGDDKVWIARVPDAALRAQAAKLDAKRFLPFPASKYQPRRILGAGGFGVVFLCKHREMDDLVGLDRQRHRVGGELAEIEVAGMGLEKVIKRAPADLVELDAGDDPVAEGRRQSTGARRPRSAIERPVRCHDQKRDKQRNGRCEHGRQQRP